MMSDETADKPAAPDQTAATPAPDATPATPPASAPATESTPQASAGEADAKGETSAKDETNDKGETSAKGEAETPAAPEKPTEPEKLSDPEKTGAPATDKSPEGDKTPEAEKTPEVEKTPQVDKTPEADKAAETTAAETAPAAPAPDKPASAAPPAADAPKAAEPTEAASPETEKPAPTPAAPSSAEAPKAAQPPATAEATATATTPEAATSAPLAAPAATKPGSLLFGRNGARTQQSQQPEAPPAAPPKRKKKRRDGTLSAMSGFLSFLLVGLVASVFGVIALLHKLKEPGPLGAEKIVYMPPRSDVPEMLAQLEREGVIDSPGLMNFALLLQNARGKLKPGEYLFHKQISLREVIDEMVAGRQVMHGLTIPEGLTSEQIAQRLRDSDLLVGDILETPKEGALLPETYKFPRGFPRSKLIAKMQDDQRKLVDQIWAKRARDLPLRSPFELVTLASIVEKETGKAEERPRVAAVFMNRLRKGMRLQSDPTIVYGLVGGKATLGRGILRSEIEKWTPYNTYAIDGLPPGPIANPGKAALEAVANPAHTKDLYFVADGTGGHVFAESLDQHSRNVQNWRRIEQDRKAGPGAAEPADQSVPAAVPPAAPRGDKRTEAPLGRLAPLAARQEDYPPPGREVGPDAGAAHRLGLFGSAGPAFHLGGLTDPTADAAPHLARLRKARPYFTQEAAQSRIPAGDFDPAMIAARAAAPEADSEDGAIGPDMLARESADGKALPDMMGQDIAAYPVSPARRADQKARAARLGLSAGSDELPADALGARVSPEDATTTRVSQEALALASTAPQRARPRAFDASEGTALDPLRDRSWDLTSAKTVPSTTSIR